MHADYYRNTLYPLQDNVLNIVAAVDNHFYLTGGTALGRAWLHHRYSDDLDFFVNNDARYKEQVQRIIQALERSKLDVERADMQDSFSRFFIQGEKVRLKIDFINDIEYRVGEVNSTTLFVRTDTMRNILSNKVTAIGRLEAKDVVDILYIARNLSFNWMEIFEEAGKKDMWVNPVDTAALLEQFPIEKTDTIAWIGEKPEEDEFKEWLHIATADILTGENNSLYQGNGRT